jgi:1-acyl-sn-glycerol-3-phosphate acyltransferase
MFGWLALLQRSVFIDRQIRSTREQRDSIARRLAGNEALVLFPEVLKGLQRDGG